MSVTLANTLPDPRQWATLQAALRASGHHVYEYDVASGRLSWPLSGGQVFGHPDATIATLDAWLQHVHSDDRLLAHSALGDAGAVPVPLAGHGGPYVAAAPGADAAGSRDQSAGPRFRLRDAAGRERWVESRGAQFEAGRRRSCVGTLVDVTAQQRAEQRQGSSGRVLEAVREAIAVTDRDGTVLWANTAFGVLVGEGHEPLVGRSLQSYCAASESHRLEQLQEIRDTVARRGVWQGRIDVRRADGQRAVTEAAVTLLAGEHGEQWVHVRRDVTERVALEEATIAAARREQHHFGLELHDRLGQELAGTSMLVRTLRKAVGNGAAPDPALLGDVERLLQSSVARCRDLAQRVTPFLIDDGGLGAALEDLAARCRAASGVALRVDVCERSARLDGNFGFHLFRLVQLALAAVLDRDDVTTADLQVWWEEDDRVAFALVADGRSHRTPADAADTRMLAHRLALLGGSFESLDASRGRSGLLAMVPVPVEGATVAGLRGIARRA